MSFNTGQRLDNNYGVVRHEIYCNSFSFYSLFINFFSTKDNDLFLKILKMLKLQLTLTYSRLLSIMNNLNILGSIMQNYEIFMNAKYLLLMNWGLLNDLWLILYSMTVLATVMIGV